MQILRRACWPLLLSLMGCGQSLQIGEAPKAPLPTCAKQKGWGVDPPWSPPNSCASTVLNRDRQIRTIERIMGHEVPRLQSLSDEEILSIFCECLANQ